jgi:hypothetical protein
VEAEAKNKICDQGADLNTIQRTMADDWTLLYRDWFGNLPAKVAGAHVLGVAERSPPQLSVTA